VSEVAPYERRPDETDRAWLAFQTYRDAGPGRQKIAVYRHMYSKPRARCPAGFFSAWAREHEWDKRALAWDRVVDEHRRQKLLEDSVNRDMIHVEALRGLMEKLLESLAHKDVHDITMRDIIQGVEMIIETERLIAGEATERTEVKASLEQMVLSGRIPEDVLQEISRAPVDQAIDILEQRMGNDPEVRALLTTGGEGE